MISLAGEMSWRSRVERYTVLNGTHLPCVGERRQTVGICLHICTSMINNNTTVHVYVGMLELPLHKDGLVDIRVPGVGYWIERERALLGARPGEGDCRIQKVLIICGSMLAIL